MIIANFENILLLQKLVITFKGNISCVQKYQSNISKNLLFDFYSSFVGSTLYLDGEKASDLSPVWLMDPKTVEQETHEDFYRYISNMHDKPRFVHHFRADAPLG